MRPKPQNVRAPQGLVKRWGRDVRPYPQYGGPLLADAARLAANAREYLESFAAVSLGIGIGLGLFFIFGGGS